MTVFIQEAISKYKKKHPRKKVVLLIEDLDRLDPAHLFRILNVLSAHMDYSYKLGLSPKPSSLVGNKFGVDNIVLVMDYTNMEKIFHHFYGTETRIEGYINKFCSNEIFRYSFSVVRDKYIIEHLIAETGLSYQELELLLPKNFFHDRNLRSIVQAIHNTSNQLFGKNHYHDVNTDVDLPDGVLKLMVVMRRLGQWNDNIVDYVVSAIRKDPFTMMRILGGYCLIMEDTFSVSFEVVRSRQQQRIFVKINGVNEKGYARVETTQNYLLNDDRPDDVPKLVKWLLERVGR